MPLFKPQKENMESSVKLGQKNQPSKKELESFPEPPAPTESNEVLDILAGKKEEESVTKQIERALVYSDEKIIEDLAIVISNQAVIFNAIEKIAKRAGIDLKEP